MAPLRVYIHQAEICGSGPFWTWTVYILSVYHNGLTVRVPKRYSELRELFDVFSLEFPGKDLGEFPEKALLSTSKVVIQKRVESFNELFKLWTSDPELVSHTWFRQFVGIDRCFSDDLLLPRSRALLSSVSAPSGMAPSIVSASELVSEVEVRLPKPVTPPCLRASSPLHDMLRREEVKSGERSAREREDVILCPILARPMHDAVVVVPCGHSFSQAGIDGWLARSETCPTCRGSVASVLPNYSLRNIIAEIMPTPS